MSDPRNVAHAKKVSQEKKHQGTEMPLQGTPAARPGKKSAAAPSKGRRAASAPPSDSAPVEAMTTPETAATPVASGQAATLEASLVVLTKLKELEFHSRAHLERLAELSMTVEDELKQTAMAGPFSDVYAAQSAFQTKLTALIESYKDECDRMQAATA